MPGAISCFDIKGTLSVLISYRVMLVLYDICPDVEDFCMTANTQLDCSTCDTRQGLRIQCQDLINSLPGTGQPYEFKLTWQDVVQ